MSGCDPGTAEDGRRLPILRLNLYELVTTSSEPKDGRPGSSRPRAISFLFHAALDTSGYPIGYSN